MNTLLSEIATAAHNRQKKTTKAEAFSIINAMIRKANTTDGDTVKETDASMTKNLVLLYSFFLPPTPAKPKTVDQWINLAVPKKDVRYFLNSAHADGETFHGTDGHRLHLSPDTRAAGYYNAQGVKIDVDGKYPDVNRVIPDLKNGYEQIDLSDLSKFRVRANTDTKWDAIVLREPDDKNAEAVVVNSIYLKTALSLNSPVVRAWVKPNCAIMIEFENDCKAVVMPMRT